LKDGYQTLITFAADTTVNLWEKTVKPPGIDGGDAIEQTTMRNTALRQMAARSLKTLTNSESTCAYDPEVYSSILALINVETTVTVLFPNGDTLAFYGYLQKFEPQEHKEGEQPEAQITVIPTNTDPSDYSEAAPVYTAYAGT
jgi:hypothetical protein